MSKGHAIWWSCPRCAAQHYIKSNELVHPYLKDAHFCDRCALRGHLVRLMHARDIPRHVRIAALKLGGEPGVYQDTLCARSVESYSAPPRTGRHGLPTTGVARGKHG